MTDIVKEFNTLMADLKLENERLRIENGLLREASKEQRELNGRLRIELSNHIHPKGQSL